jgi:16S rRNA (guanine(966)-N(2))-methyltransferase RsmD
MAQPRIIAGSARGIRLDSVPGDTTRPITDRVKEALFNIIGTDIVEATFLDVFSGTGSVGIEALSRGAKQCVFLDLAPLAVKTIKKNLESTRTAQRAQVHHIDSFQYLRSQTNATFDYIYVAPPQYKGLWLKTLELLNNNSQLLSGDGWVIVQIDPVEDMPFSFPNFVEFDRRRYGSTLLLFLTKPENPMQG